MFTTHEMIDIANGNGEGAFLLGIMDKMQSGVL